MNTFEPTTFFLTPVIMEQDGKTKEYYALHDGRGNLYSSQEVQDLIQKIQPFYSLENTKELIEEDNKQSFVEMKLRNYCQNYEIKMPEYKDGRFQIPKPRYRFKEFKTDKRQWSCTCDWCGNKISSRTDKGYYLISNSIFSVNERACSEDCLNLIWKETMKNWIHENECEQYFEQI